MKLEISCSCKFKNIIYQLIAIREAQTTGKELLPNQGQALDGYSALANYNSLADEAKQLMRE